MASKTISDSGNVRKRILDVAERLFTEKGLQVSVRELTAEAGVNQAGINYYFTSKAGLTQAVFERLSKRINERRILELEAILGPARTLKQKPDMRNIIRAFLQPYFDGKDNGKLLATIILQHRIEPSDLTNLIIDRHFAPMAERFLDAFAEASPGVSKSKFYWRYAFMISTIILTLVNIDGDDFIEQISRGRTNSKNLKKLADELTDFLVAGVSAPNNAG